MTSSHVKVAIIGGGPAGLTAAVYTSRALLDTTVISGQEIGGQLMLTTEVENFPGFPDGIMGPELMQKMQVQAERFGTKVLREKALAIETQTLPFTIQTETQVITADTIILAMGADHRHLGFPSEEKLRGHGVSYCATCDGFFFRGKDIAVVGGGDSAMEEALFLTKFANKVYVIHRRDTLRASAIMQEKAKANPKIELVLNSEVKEIMGDTVVTGLKLYDNATDKETTLSLQGVFVAIGMVPNTAWLAGKIAITPQGYIETKENYHTSVEGIFVAGDVHDHRYRQAVTAAGFGCAAALEAERYLAQKAHLMSQNRQLMEGHV